MSVKTTFRAYACSGVQYGCGRNRGRETGVNSALGVAPKTQGFVTEAGVSDLTEIAAAKIALQKGDRDQKQFGEQMVKDHTQTRIFEAQLALLGQHQSASHFIDQSPPD